MKITLKNVILSFIIIFNLVIIFSNFNSYEALEIRINDSEPKPQPDTSKTTSSDPTSSSSNQTSNVSNTETPSSNKSKSETPLGNETSSGNNSKFNYETPM